MKSMMSYQALPLPGDREADEQNTLMFRVLGASPHTVLGMVTNTAV